MRIVSSHAAIEQIIDGITNLLEVYSSIILVNIFFTICVYVNS